MPKDTHPNLCKPFDPVVLRSKVEIFAELYRQRVTLSVEAATLRKENARLRHILTSQNSRT